MIASKKQNQPTDLVPTKEVQLQVAYTQEDKQEVTQFSANKMPHNFNVVFYDEKMDVLPYSDQLSRQIISVSSFQQQAHYICQVPPPVLEIGIMDDIDCKIEGCGSSNGKGDGIDC